MKSSYTSSEIIHRSFCFATSTICSSSSFEYTYPVGLFGELIRIAFVFGDIACFRFSVLIVKSGFVFTMIAFAFMKLHRSGYITKYGSNTISSSSSSRIAEYDRNIPPLTPDDTMTLSANLFGEYFSRIFCLSSGIPADCVYPVLSFWIASIMSSLISLGTLKSG